MPFSHPSFLLYGVTDASHNTQDSLLHSIQEAIAGGVTCIQIRLKHTPTHLLVQLAEPAVQFCKKAHIPCIINDDVEAAALLHADGVHVGQKDCSIAQARAVLGKNAQIGTSAHTVAEAIRAQQEGADYIGCGAVFGSQTKTDATTLNHAELYRICQAVTIPVVAIGGIQPNTIQQLSGIGINGIAVVSALFGQQNITAAAKTLRTMAESVCRREG